MFKKILVMFVFALFVMPFYGHTEGLLAPRYMDSLNGIGDKDIMASKNKAPGKVSISTKSNKVGADGCNIEGEVKVNRDNDTDTALLQAGAMGGIISDISTYIVPTYKEFLVEQKLGEITSAEVNFDSSNNSYSASVKIKLENGENLCDLKEDLAYDLQGSADLFFQGK